MFHHILRPIWAITVKPYKLKSEKLKKMAGVAFICLMLSFIFAGITTWISQPVYESYARISMDTEKAYIAGWTVAIIVAVAMFLFLSTLGYAISEKLNKTKITLDKQFIVITAILAISIGTFDAYKGSTKGAAIKARQHFKTETFNMTLASVNKPFQEEIDKLDVQIENLQNDKIMWMGKLTTRERSSRKVGALISERSKFIGMQLNELKNMSNFHKETTENMISNRNEATNTLSGIAIVLYIIQIILAIPIGNFDIVADLADGRRDGRY